MFRKLLSNLPFNPSLIGQVSFYAKRLHRESALRRSGLIVLSLAMALQVFAVISPPQPTLARSDNDLIVGGITSKEEAVRMCQQNIRSYKTLLAYYGVSCDDLANTTTVTIKSTDNNGRLYSMGHLAYGKKGETPVNVPQAGTVYMRPLHSWDTGYYSKYKALKGITKDGKTFFILYNCGNLVLIGLPAPEKTCKYNPKILASDPKCYEPCPIKGKEDYEKKSPKCVEPCPYNKSLAANSDKCFEPCPVSGKKDLPKTSPECFTPCEFNSLLSANDPSCKPCKESQTKADLTACIEYRKTVSNTTQKLSDANGTTAKPGDILTYTLITSNKGKAKIPAYSVSENISDVLDYAEIVNTNGGTLSDDKVLSWPVADIKGGASLQKQFSVRIKAVIPQTPSSSSDPGHFDLKITNVYGNTVEVKLPSSVAKTTEVLTVRTLPNTGPGTTLAIAFVATSFAAYLFARSRLLAEELDIVRADYGSRRS